MKTVGQSIANTLTGCDIICSRDTERVAKRIDDRYTQAVKALERAEELITKIRDRENPLWIGKKDEIAPTLRDVRLALFDLTVDQDKNATP